MLSNTTKIKYTKISKLMAQKQKKNTFDISVLTLCFEYFDPTDILSGRKQKLLIEAIIYQYATT